MFNSQWEITEGREKIYLKKTQKQSFLQKKCNVKRDLILLKGGGDGIGLRVVLGLTQKYIFGK